MRFLPLFEKMGKTIVHQGPAGAGQHTKMVNQVLIAANMIGVCEALLYGVQGGARLERGAPERLHRGRRVVEPEQPGRPRDRGQLRARFFRRALSQGYGNRPGRGPADEAQPAGIGPRRTALSGSRRPRICTKRNTMPSCSHWPSCPRSTGPHSPTKGPIDASSESPLSLRSRSDRDLDLEPRADLRIESAPSIRIVVFPVSLPRTSLSRLPQRRTYGQSSTR